MCFWCPMIDGDDMTVELDEVISGMSVVRVVFD